MRWLLMLSFFLLILNTISAQTPIRLDENSIVKDSTGKQYTYQEWQPMIKRDFTLKPATPSNSDKPEFILVRLSEKAVAERLLRDNERMEKMPKPRESGSFKTGERMSLFNSSDMNGSKVNLKEMKGKILVINFWFINCGPCRKEIPDLNELVDSFSTSGKVVFIGIALDNKTSLEEFLEKQPFRYTIIDNGRYLADRYGIRLYPTHVIVDTDGRVYFHTTGLASNTAYWLKKSINELLAKQSTASTN